MKTRREFLKRSTAAGIAGIIASGKAPAYAQDMGLLKIGQIGIGHNFALQFRNRERTDGLKLGCKPYGFWYDVHEICERFKTRGFEKVYKDPEELIKESDVISIEYPDYGRTLEFAQPALEQGKPVFVDRPFTGTIYSAEKMVELAIANDAPLMSASSLELQPELPEIQKWAKDYGPILSYMCYCPEPMFVWMFPHVINFAHAALGGGINTAYFSGDYIIEMGNIQSERHKKWYDPGRPLGAAVSLLTYKPRSGEPPIIGMNHIGPGPGPYNIYVYCKEDSKNFVVGEHLDAPKIFQPMLVALNDFFVNRKLQRPYEALLEQHRALVATNMSRITGRAVKLDSLGGEDALPYSPSIKDWLDRIYLR
ncbi:MAG: Gfo/Idh/MocA family oxidoreductase [Candidatus Latescibacteria bacterium]|nr:Gfo/Idh/MocA family oxidoreductase [Candidatus Latescibacterota bacterium]